MTKVRGTLKIAFLAGAVFLIVVACVPPVGTVSGKWYMQFSVSAPAAKGLSVTQYSVTGLTIVVKDPGGVVIQTITWAAADGTQTYDVPVSQAGHYEVDVTHIGVQNGQTIQASESATFDIEPMKITQITIIPGQIGTITVQGALVLLGPTLDTNIAGWPDSGLQIYAKQSVTLAGFTFNNQGLADTITLRDSGGNVLQTYNAPAGNTSQVITVNWPLTAGATYHLQSANGNNGRWTSFSGFPAENADIRVDGTWGGGSLQTAYWFTFTGLTTSH